MACLAWRVDGGRFKTYSIDTPNEYRDNGYESLDAERTRIVDFPSDVPPDQKNNTNTPEPRTRIKE